MKQSFEKYSPKNFKSKITVKRAIGPVASQWTIPTLEGVMTANIGDYIIEGLRGEYYPCKPDIFEKSYEPA